MLQHPICLLDVHDNVVFTGILLFRVSSDSSKSLVNLALRVVDRVRYALYATFNMGNTPIGLQL